MCIMKCDRVSENTWNLKKKPEYAGSITGSFGTHEGICKTIHPAGGARDGKLMIREED